MQLLRVMRCTVRCTTRHALRCITRHALRCAVVHRNELLRELDHRPAPQQLHIRFFVVVATEISLVCHSCASVR